jgi:thioredoxin 1
MENLNLESFKLKVYDYEKSKDWKFNGVRPAIIDFYADWCAPCHSLAPVFEEVSHDFAGRIDFYKINTETEPELATLFGVRGIPAIFFLPMDGEPAMSAGFMPRESFHKAIADIFQIT